MDMWPKDVFLSSQVIKHWDFVQEEYLFGIKIWNDIGENEYDGNFSYALWKNKQFRSKYDPTKVRLSKQKLSVRLFPDTIPFKLLIQCHFKFHSKVDLWSFEFEQFF